MATTIIFNETTATGTSEDINISADQGRVVLAVSGLQGGETIVLKTKVLTNYEPIVENGAAIVLDVNNSNQMCTGPAIVQLVKPTTAGNVPVVLYTRYPEQAE